MPNAYHPRLLLVGGAAVALYLWSRQMPSDPPTAQEVGTSVRHGLLGDTRTRDFVAETRAALAGESSFLAVRVTRAYCHTEMIHRSILGFTSGATIVVTYGVEYPVGYDLKPSEFVVAEQGGAVTVTLHRPHLIAAPAVQLLSSDIPDRGFFVDEETALIELQQRVVPMVQRRAAAIALEPVVVAQAEQALTGFLRGLLARNGPPPTIRLTYD